MASPNVFEYCVFHIKTIEVLNETPIGSETRKKAISLFSPTSTSQNSPERDPFANTTRPAEGRNPLRSTLVNVPISFSAASKQSLSRSLAVSEETVEQHEQKISVLEPENTPFEIEQKLATTEPRTDSTIFGSDTLRGKRQQLRLALHHADDLRRESVLLERDIGELRETIRVKADHLAVLRKQMMEQSVESYMSDSEGFCAQEEKASAAEIQELEKKLAEKETRREGLARGLEEAQHEILRLEGDVGRQKCAMSQTFQRGSIDVGVTPRFSLTALHGLRDRNRAVAVPEELNIDETGRGVDEGKEKSTETGTEMQRRVKKFFAGLLTKGCSCQEGRTAEETKKWETAKHVVEDPSANFDHWISRCLDLLEGQLIFASEKKALEDRVTSQSAELAEKYRQEQTMRSRMAGLESELTGQKSQPNSTSNMRRTVTQYHEKISSLQEQLTQLNNTVTRSSAGRSRCCSMSMGTGGVRSTLKLLQTLEEGERTRGKCEELEGENAALKKKLSHEVDYGLVQSTIHRAGKLANYLADRLGGERVGSEMDPWRVMDVFTRQARAYIRAAEKGQRGEDDQGKLPLEKKRLLAEIERLGAKERGIRESLRKETDTQARITAKFEYEIGIYNKRIDSLKEMIGTLQADKVTALKELQDGQRVFFVSEIVGGSGRQVGRESGG